MARVFKALADPTRRRLLDRLRADNGQTLSALCRDLATTRQGITQHLALLEATGLITTVRRGRERLHYLNPVPLHEIYERWIAKFERPDLEALSGLKKRLEEDTHDGQAEAGVRHVHRDHTRAALERPHPPRADRTVLGAPQCLRLDQGRQLGAQRLDDGGADGVGTILEVDPPRRLAHSWAWPADADDAAKHSRVTFDLEPVGDVVRLTLTRTDLTPEDFEGANKGWAIVLSSLKSLLETGRPLSSLL